ncbi:hypothetical protein NE865_08448 [Phthorimaea operculella]|nr:hypothetical protein NE865_08448 [Phthorimaea operculella]
MDLSSQLTSTSADMAALFARMTNFEERLQKVTTSPAAGYTDLSALSSDFLEFKTLVWQALGKLKAQTELLSLGQDRHETFLRRKVLLFHGVAEKKEEKVEEVILSILSDKMQLSDMNITDLQTCHRLGSASSKPRPVLVRFRDLGVRRLAWDSKTSLKSTGITISEFLTKSRHDLFMEARQHFGVRNCWTSEGKIVVLLPDKTRKRVEVLSELKRLTAVYPPHKDSTTSRSSDPTDPPQKKNKAQEQSSKAAAAGGRVLRDRRT